MDDPSSGVCITRVSIQSDQKPDLGLVTFNFYHYHFGRSPCTSKAAAATGNCAGDGSRSASLLRASAHGLSGCDRGQHGTGSVGD